MAWSLSLREPKNGVLIDDFLLAVGKSVYLATQFEAKCRHLLRLAHIVQHMDETRDGVAALDLARAMRDKMLKATLDELAVISPLKDTDIPLLDRARVARNVIAHEIADIGSLDSASVRVLEEQEARLRQEVAALAAGDNLVSSWLYEIGEREPAPRAFMSQYPMRLRQWIFGDEEEDAS